MNRWKQKNVLQKKHYEKENERESEWLHNDLGYIQSPTARWTFASLRRTLWFTVPYIDWQEDDLCYCSNVGKIISTASTLSDLIQATKVEINGKTILWC